MKKIYRLLIILVLITLILLTLLHYFFTYNLEPFELSFIRILTILWFNLIFFALIFLIDINYYKQIFNIVLIFVASVWIFQLFLTLFKFELFPRYYGNLWELSILLTFSILAPGLILYIINYIIKKIAKYNDAVVKGKYHLHEGFVGFLLISAAISFIIFRSILILYGRLLSYFKFLLTIIQIMLFFSLFIGSFLILRDWHDVVRFKFIEIRNKINNNINQNHQTFTFNRIAQEDLHFYKHLKLTIYPLGIILTNFGMNIIGIASGFLFNNIFDLKNESITYFGYLCCFIGGGIIGRDWVRIFKKINPTLYWEIETAINSLKS